MNKNDKWSIIYIKTGKEINSAPSKKEALEIVDLLNRQEVIRGRAKGYAVLPRTGK